METLIIPAAENVQSTFSIPLPYYASFDYFGISEFVAIYSKHIADNVRVSLLGTINPVGTIGSFNAEGLPVDHTPITEAEFMEALDTAYGRIQSKLQRVETI